MHSVHLLFNSIVSGGKSMQRTFHACFQPKHQHCFSSETVSTWQISFAATYNVSDTTSSRQRRRRFYVNGHYLSAGGPDLAQCNNLFSSNVFILFSVIIITIITVVTVASSVPSLMSKLAKLTWAIIMTRLVAAKRKLIKTDKQTPIGVAH